MLRTCKTCNIEKEINEFVKSGEKYRYLCKSCRCLSRRTGRPNTGRFQKGHTKGKRFEKGNIPWYKLKGVEAPRKGKVDKENEKRFTSDRYREWRLRVIEKNGKECSICHSIHQLHVHHIKPWNEEEKLRFDVDNGKVLCNSCHAKEEGFKKGSVQVISNEIREKAREKLIGRKFSLETLEKMRNAKLGKIPWNKGLKKG